jgi:hypothetical protein
VSDGRRSHKAKPAVRVHTTWPNHPRYGRAFDDVEIRGVVVGIWIMAHRAHASKTNDTVSLSGGDILAITGRERSVDAAKVLRTACEAMSYELRKTPDQPARWSIRVRNFSRKQGFEGRDGKQPAPTAPPSESESLSPSESASLSPTPSAPTRGGNGADRIANRDRLKAQRDLVVDDIVRATGDGHDLTRRLYENYVDRLGEQAVRELISRVSKPEVFNPAGLFSDLAQEQLALVMERRVALAR